MNSCPQFTLHQSKPHHLTITIHLSFVFSFNVVGASLLRITLDEDVALRGFTPLMCNAQQPVYTHKNVEMVTEIALNSWVKISLQLSNHVFSSGISPNMLAHT